MAFTGVAVVKQVADNLVRITGLSLAGDGANGTIGLFPKTVAPGVRLPEGFKAIDFKRTHVDVSLQDAVDCEVVYTNQGATAIAMSVVKAGTTPEDFEITLTNNTVGTASGDLEIYVRWH